MPMLRLSLTAAALALSACGPTDFGSGTLASQTRPATGYQTVSVANAITAKISEGAATDVTLSGDDNLLPLVEVVTVGSELQIRFKMTVRAEQRLPMTATFTMPRLEGIHASGASNVTADAVRADGTATVDASGASHVTVATVAAQQLTVEASGASEVTAAGTVTTADLTASGASTIKAGTLLATTVAAHASGASNITASASMKVTGSASGASTITVLGQPAERAVDSSGASSVNF